MCNLFVRKFNGFICIIIIRIFISIDELHYTRKKKYKSHNLIRKILVLLKFFNTTYIRANAVIFVEI